MPETLVFYLLAGLAIGASALVIGQRNPMYSVMMLIASFGALAGLYVQLDAPFVAVVQIIIYAGAIMVLFLFVIMLLNLGDDYRRDVRGGLAMLVGFGVTGAMGGLLARQLTDGTRALATNLGPGDAIDAALLEYGAVGVIARPLFTEYLVPFELTGILLLVAIVGAIALSKKAS